MINKKDVDFGKTAQDYAQHRAGFPESFFTTLQNSGLVSGQKDILDLGTGTGTVARGLAKMGHAVVGIDKSDELLVEARKLDLISGVQISYRQGLAESTNFLANSFDIITAGQCWHWFNQDEVVSEINRILRPNGILIVCYFDWLNEEGNPVALMYELQKKYNPNWKSVWPLGFYPSQPGDLKLEGYTALKFFRYKENIPYSHEGWRGRMRAYAGIGGSLPIDIVNKFDEEFASELKNRFPNEPMNIPHKIWAEAWKKSTKN